MTTRGWMFVVILAATFDLACGAPDDIDLGRRIYEQGVLSDGQPLSGLRNEVRVSGVAAACAQCHRNSGMGSVEGDIQVPPVTGPALFGGGDKVIATMDPRSGKAFNRTHLPYTDETLARALREGLNSEQRAMNVVMPHYSLNAADMRALNAYLRQLSTQWSAGVGNDLIRFASVITPNVDAKRRALFKDMLAKMVKQKNGSTAVATKKGGRRHMAGAAEMVLGTERNWVIDVWELRGTPDTWGRQLDQLYEQQPVFALVSGLGADNWEPVQEFCERHQLPAWFPSVDLPPAPSSRYSIYFSRGVALEAEVLAAHLNGLGTARPNRVIQVFRDDYVGVRAAHVLARGLTGSDITVEDRVIASSDAAAMQGVLADVIPADVVMFWLRAADLSVLEKVAIPAVTTYSSSILSEPDSNEFPVTLKSSMRLVYPYELPDLRQANEAYFKAWLRNRKIELIDEPMQSEVYFAIAFLTDCVTEMLDNLYRDYLIERAESMISRRESSRVEAEVWASTRSIRQRLAAAPEGDSGLIADTAPTALQQAGMVQGVRQGTTVYPRLGLGPGQRFASKGGYIVRFGGADNDTLVAESKWIVP